MTPSFRRSAKNHYRSRCRTFTYATQFQDLLLPVTGRAVKKMTTCRWNKSQDVIEERLNKRRRQLRLQSTQQYV